MIVNRMPVLAIWIALGAYFGTGVTVSLSTPAIQGTASVIDADTIEIRGERIRLDAIDAPESSQLCLDADSKRYRCGQKSALALADFIAIVFKLRSRTGHIEWLSPFLFVLANVTMAILIVGTLWRLGQVKLLPPRHKPL